MVAIADMQPKLLGLKAMLEAYVEHRRDVVTRRTRLTSTRPLLDSTLSKA
ncbi:DNA topoisomerase IV subunit A [Lacticaseibacillus paracasei subsp. paracasei Lpp71]|uniref:DNA topoisomerase IV subunit A n=1 Tax=Lacticaseibacillus paracasei subsp. paracasei Lpp71 TaxID=1256207 RepID=A0A8E0IQV1_LACPA|nr:DNA topoisomerase IV subunit A [Lacticaseibacillus paracasei subsp. paracasei Lpp71]